MPVCVRCACLNVCESHRRSFCVVLAEPVRGESKEQHFNEFVGERLSDQRTQQYGSTVGEHNYRSSEKEVPRSAILHVHMPYAHKQGYNKSARVHLCTHAQKGC